MTRNGVVVVGVIVLVLSASVFSIFSLSFAFGRDTGSESSVNVVEELKRHIDRQSQSAPSVDREVEVAVPLPNGTNTATMQAISGSFEIDRVSTKADRRYAHGSMAMSDIRQFLRASNSDRVRIMGSNSVASDGRVASGVSAIAADRLHRRGITGQNVTVGIIDSDFRLSHPAIASRVRGYAVIDPSGSGDIDKSSDLVGQSESQRDSADTEGRSPSGSRTLSRDLTELRSVGSQKSKIPGDPTEQIHSGNHGTAVASVVVDTAPDATLQLAAVGSTTTPEEYASAVEWLQRSGVDIIVDAGSYYAQPGDGTGAIAQIAQNASDETVFVTSVGNHADRYWSGNASSNTWVTAYNGTQANPLNNGDPLSGPVELTLRWDGWPSTDVDYDLYLFRVQPGTDAVVARATGHDGRPFEHLRTSVPRGRYYVSIRSGDSDTTTQQLELFTNHPLRYRSIGGRVAPATANGVIAVGAVEGDSVKPFSARGADIVAPDSVAVEDITIDGGTSVSTPYVAGTAALVLGVSPELSPEQVRTLLFSSADDVGASGVGPRSGHGVVNATRAIDRTTIDDRVRPTVASYPRPHSSRRSVSLSAAERVRL